MTPTDTEAAIVVRATRRRKSFAERMRAASGIVLVEPGTNLRSLYVARVLGTPLSLVGIGAMTVGSLLAVTGLVADPAVFASFVGELFTGEQTENALLSTAGLTFLGGMGSYLAGAGLIRGARHRACRSGVLTVTEMVYGPKNIKEPMTRALTAAETIRGSVAYRERWLADFDLDAALWDLARHLHSAIRLRDELGTVPARLEQDTQVERARAALQTCVVHVEEGAERLAALADRVEAFDRELAAPARRVELEKARELRAQRDAEQIGRLSAAAAEVEAIEPALGGVADQVTGVLDAYDELPTNKS
ncbi:hypothetical protein [Rhodococcus artemisiae]|uniref:5-bromo-4-chloroindolyl phosphate hydrolysis protein n=1 Tax=Rhodococcus artemisiae TaxID=714159 RepID=A0ABU7LKW8_9NOCA|nr:hypothetical protein [Rhodococcus artemisiae]MEE2062208.1 hypothetical protein [Rhodococcus artemisiae]